MLQFWLVANTVLWPFSIKLGGLSLDLNVVVLLLAGSAWLWKKPTISRSSAKVLICLLACTIISMIVAVSSPCADKLLKAAITAPILTSLAFIGWETGRRARASDWISLNKAAICSLALALAGFIVEVAVPSMFPAQADYRSHGKLSGLFQEPSHAAFSLFPCLAILMVAQSKRARRIGTMGLFALLLLSRSSTAVAFVVVWLLYRMVANGISRQAASLTLMVASLVAVGGFVNYERFVAPTADRIMGVLASDSTENLSSLVYVQGWQDTWANLSRTHGLGLGFNMMGCQPLPDVPARELLSVWGMGELNAEDGSFQFAKIVSEFGVAGIVFYAAIIWWWIRFERQIREIDDPADRCAAATQAALIFCFITSSFIRAGSYFSGGLLLWLIATSGASKWMQRMLVAQAARKRSHPVGQGRSGTVECV